MPYQRPPENRREKFVHEIGIWSAHFAEEPLVFAISHLLVFLVGILLGILVIL